MRSVQLYRMLAVLLNDDTSESKIAGIWTVSYSSG